MKYVSRGLLGLLAVFAVQAVLTANPPAKRSAREALQPFNNLIGSWRATGMPDGTREEKQQFWTENMAWEWQFKDKDAWLKVVFTKGKYFTGGELRYLPEKDQFQLALTTTTKETLTFTGPLKERVLALERTDDKLKETQRLVFDLLHSNRFVYRYEVRPENKSLFTRRYKVGVTKEGEAFAAGDGKPECIVSGGAGTIPVSYKGQTYYVCCGGCRDEFRANPEQYIKEYEAKKAKKK
jgi:hypothetical protein